MGNPPVDGPEATRLLQRLASPEPQEAWEQFLNDYSRLIHQVIQVFERETDRAGDCFLFVCEKLSENRFRRLRRFKPGGSARFSTWLRVVVRNLCLDWHRKAFGRQQIFQSIAELAPLDQEVFRAVYRQNLSAEGCYFRLAARHPGLTRRDIEDSLSRIRQKLSPRQRWLLQAGRPRFGSLEAASEDEPGVSQSQVTDPGPGPEELAAAKEQQAALQRALGTLETSERLLLKLRFDQEMTLQGIARLLGLKDAQTADRRVRDVLQKLRKKLHLYDEGSGKPGAPSV